ncbi:uncharacterized protein LOC143036442 [Oratosquilla oratoria]|uniref:uncharacterized protein LOC143036442 n=1 Tax=Oratosquilla oratoria TaxID=337810 RepID=UPI003F76B3B8
MISSRTPFEEDILAMKEKFSSKDILKQKDNSQRAESTHLSWNRSSWISWPLAFLLHGVFDELRDEPSLAVRFRNWNTVLTLKGTTPLREGKTATTTESRGTSPLPTEDHVAGQIDSTTNGSPKTFPEPQTNTAKKSSPVKIITPSVSPSRRSPSGSKSPSFTSSLSPNVSPSKSKDAKSEYKDSKGKQKG